MLNQALVKLKQLPAVSLDLLGVDSQPPCLPKVAYRSFQLALLFMNLRQVMMNSLLFGVYPTTR